MKKLLSDWKFYVMVVSMVMVVFVDLMSEDYISAVWVVLAFVLWCQNYMLQEVLSKSEKVIDDVIDLQASIINELNNMLNEQTKSNENGVRDTELEEGVERSEKNMG